MKLTFAIARVISEELSQDLITKGNLSNWFSRDDTPPTAVALRKKPNPRNLANAVKAEELEKELERCVSVSSLKARESNIGQTQT